MKTSLLKMIVASAVLMFFAFAGAANLRAQDGDHRGQGRGFSKITRVQDCKVCDRRKG